MTESNVAIVPDSVATGAHNIRTVTVNVDNSAVVAGGQAEQQQVVTIADSVGNLVDFAAESYTTQALLRALILRIDCLVAAVDKNYTPPDDIAYSD